MTIKSALSGIHDPEILINWQMTKSPIIFYSCITLQHLFLLRDFDWPIVPPITWGDGQMLWYDQLFISVTCYSVSHCSVWNIS
jgi:hypothetical protein